MKTEDDAEMAHQVSAHLIRALTDYKETTGKQQQKLLQDWIKFLIPQPQLGEGEFIKSFGEEYQAVKRGREHHGFGEEYNVKI